MSQSRKALENMGLVIPEGGKVLEMKLPEGLVAPTKRNKYGAKPTVYNGLRYASKAEADRARFHDSWADRGVHAIRQPRFHLGCPENVYVADFLVWGPGGVHVEDVKGQETAKFKRDRKLWASYGPCPLFIIKGGKVADVIEGGGA